MNKRYRISVIGAGDRGNCYMGMLKTYFNEEIEWMTVCDILPDRMESAYQKYGFAHKTESFSKAIKENTPDIVVIATPAYYHCDIAMFAMRCGCHVLTEKPMDLDLSKCFALEECQKQTGRVLAVGMQYRNSANYRSLKHAFEEGLFGANKMIHYSDIRETRPKIAMHDAAYGNGGPMVDMACHLFDLMRWYYGCDPVSVSAQWRLNALNRPTLVSIETKAADACFMTITYADGSLGNIMMNWGLPSGAADGLFSLVTGSEGLIGSHRVGTTKTAEVLTSGGKTVSVSVKPEDADDLIHPERAVFTHLIGEIEGTGKVQTSIHEGILCLATSMAALRSSVLGRPVTIDEILKLRPTIAQCLIADGE